MAESLALTSFLGHRPLYTGAFVKNFSNKRRLPDNCRFPVAEVLGRRVVMASPLPRLRVGQSKNSSIKALAMELAKETYSFKEDKLPHKWNYPIDTGVDPKPGLWPPENRAYNPSLHNPLLRQERIGSGWLVVIFEWEGVLIEDNTDLEKQAWLVLSREEGKSPPSAFMLRRIEGMKNEQAMSEVLCWSRDPAQLRRMAARREDIYQALQGGIYQLRAGSREFVNVLMHSKIPTTLVSTRPRKTLEAAMGSIGIEEYFSVMVAVEDVQRVKPNPEMFEYTAQLLKFILERCIVFGNSNQTVEAAHDARMKCVVVASKHPVYELAAADLVVRRLDELSMVDLKNLAAI
ncbi:hypothetical protein ACFX2I_014595 [Malus domestica]|uniref:Uncharacterized protein n=1 Tax=Malus domestica TaxID=3750 RepID=A0A498I7C5_MALDO|nr:hypothetical protein DVH24_019891 [Malus domestica]